MNGSLSMKVGKGTPKEFIPDIPEECSGMLLRGMKAVQLRGPETKEECIARHAKLKSAFLIDPAAPIRWFNPETRLIEIIDG
jgi:hypothetical protein